MKVSFQNISKQYKGKYALKDFTTELQEGVYGLLGKDFLSKIGYMPQYPIFYRDFTVMDFLLYMCALKGIPAEQGKKRALELPGIVNLLDAKDKRIGALSGGMRQRVGIAQAMLGATLKFLF